MLRNINLPNIIQLATSTDERQFMYNYKDMEELDNFYTGRRLSYFMSQAVSEGVWNINDAPHNNPDSLRKGWLSSLI